MPIGIHVLGDNISFHIDNYQENQAECDHIEENLKRLQLPFCKEEYFSLHNDKDIQFQIKIHDIYARGITSLGVFERKILYGLSKSMSSFQAQPGDFFYLKTPGSFENSNAFHQRSELLLKELDKDENGCDLMDWCINEDEIMKEFLTNSDEYLTNFFYKENMTRKKKCEEIYSSANRHQSFLFFLSTELMTKVTEHIGPIDNNERKDPLESEKLKY